MLVSAMKMHMKKASSFAVPQKSTKFKKLHWLLLTDFQALLYFNVMSQKTGTKENNNLK